MSQLQELRAAVAYQLGRRGAFLLLIGTGWAFYGLSILTNPQPPVDPDNQILFQLLPIPLRGALWITSGLVAVAFAFRRSPGADRWGFGFLILQPIWRATSYLWAWLVSWLPLPFLPDGIGVPTAWQQVVPWVAFTAAIFIVAGWAEPRGFRPEPSSDEEIS